jgi:hypothetical protein
LAAAAAVVVGLVKQQMVLFLVTMFVAVLAEALRLLFTLNKKL